MSQPKKKVPAYRTLASGCVFTVVAGFFCGRISAKPTRKIQYAARTPNAIEPTVAQINITRFIKSVIAFLKSSVPGGSHASYTI